MTAYYSQAPQNPPLEETKNTPGAYASPAPPQYPPPPVTVQYVQQPPFQTGFTGFSEYDPRYMCCCGGQCHSKTGALIIATLCLLEAGSTVSSHFYREMQNSYGVSGWFYLSLTLALATVFVIGLLFYGVLKESHGCIIPFVVYQVCLIVLYAIIVLLALLAFAGFFFVSALGKYDSSSHRSYDENFYQTSTRSANALVIIIVLIVCGLCIALHTWWIVVVLKCYRYIRDKRMSYGYVSYGQQPPLVVRTY